MKRKSQPLQQLPNIGEKLATELAGIGIRTPQQLSKVGSVDCYVRLSLANGARHLPHCYYLFSLQAALEGRHWRHLAPEEKQRLIDEARRRLRRVA